MSNHNDKKPDEPEDFGKQLQDMLRAAKIQFMPFGGAGAAQPAGGAPRAR